MKFKLGYDINHSLKAIFTAAYENRVRKCKKPKELPAKIRAMDTKVFWSGNLFQGEELLVLIISGVSVSSGISEDKTPDTATGIKPSGSPN